MTTQAHDTRAVYRADIDGLRAIAVLAVVLFHINPAWLPGGFAGVDIFFVISGYLITGNIIKDIRSSRGFSWSEFYRRRILRILPVLFVVLLAVLAFGQLIMLPSDLAGLSKATLSALLSAANVYFTYFLDTSYFADDSSLQPLLHLWSLGVEEQFYLFWPVLLVMLLGRLSRQHFLLLTALLSVLSFGLAQWLLDLQPMFAYYMLPPRAGELLIGAMLAVYLSGDLHRPSPRMAGLAGTAGLLLIAGSLLWVTEDLGFPGVMALPSTLGAALVILAGSTGIQGASRLLALRPMMLVGLISYSLYLWHWPVLAFYRYAFGEPGLINGLLLLGLMIVLSIFSYQLVERPCRHLRWSFRQTLLRMLGGGTLLVGLCCAGLLLSKGYGLHGLSEHYRAQHAAHEPPPPAYKHRYVCQRAELKDKELLGRDCIINGQQEPGVLLWGDSNAGHYVGVVSAIAERAGFSFRNAVHSGCPPVLQGAETTQKPHRLAGCLASLERVRKQMNRYSTIIMAGAWEAYFTANPEFGRLLEQTVDQLRAEGKQVILLGQVPGFPNVDRKCAQKAIKLPMLSCSQRGMRADEGDLPANRFLETLAAHRPGTGYFNVRNLLCQGGQCNAYLDGELLYFDQSHLSMHGSWGLGRRVVQQGIPPVFAGIPRDVAPRESGSLRAELDGRQADVRSVPAPVSRSKQQAVAPAPLAVQAGSRPWPDNPVWSPLALEVRAGAWEGQARAAVEAGSLRIHDGHADNFDYLYRRLRSAELKSFLRGQPQLLVRLRVAACQGYPLLRLWSKGGKDEKYDAVIDCAAGKVLARAGLSQQDVQLTRSAEDLVLTLRMNVPADARELMLGLYPASGQEAGRYALEAMGSLLVRQLDLAGSH